MAGSILALSVKPCRACQLSQGESPWHSGIVSGSSAEFVVSPEPLPLGEVDLRSKDGEGEDADLVTTVFRERVVVESIRLCKRKRDRRSVRQSPLLL